MFILLSYCWFVLSSDIRASLLWMLSSLLYTLIIVPVTCQKELPWKLSPVKLFRKNILTLLLKNRRQSDIWIAWSIFKAFTFDFFCCEAFLCYFKNFYCSNEFIIDLILHKIFMFSSKVNLEAGIKTIGPIPSNSTR